MNFNWKLFWILVFIGVLLIAILAFSTGYEIGSDLAKTENRQK